MHPTTKSAAPRSLLGRVAANGLSAISNHLCFRVGRDRAGHWLALEEHGLAGGIFATKEAALHYAAAETARRPGAVRLVRGALSFQI